MPLAALPTRFPHHRERRLLHLVPAVVYQQSYPFPWTMKQNFLPHEPIAGYCRNDGFRRSAHCLNPFFLRVLAA
jgi:hypothetical protein